MKQKSEKVVLEAAVRTSSGKGPASAARREGLVPGVVYREGGEALSVQVSSKELSKALRTKAGENVLINLQFQADSQKLLGSHPALAKGEGIVLIKELQHHPVSSQIVHVDFHQISLTKKITVTVPLGFQGESLGVKQQGGVLEHLRWDVEVECLPTEIPAEIPVDISVLDLGKTLHVSDLALPANVKAVTPGDQPVVACVEPKKEALPTPAEEGAAATEPEVIKQKKPEDEEGTAEAGAGGKEKEAPKKEAAPKESKPKT